jgi:hypothetical protein
MRGSHYLVAAIMLSLVFAGCVGDQQTGSQSAGKKSKSVRAGALPEAQTFVATLPDGTIVDPSQLLGVPPLKGLQRNLPGRSYEPTLGVTPKGNVFMSGLTLNGGVGVPGGTQLPGSKVWGTFDGGATWKDVSPADLVAGQVHDPPYSADPYVYVDPVTGRIFDVDLQFLYCSWSSVSDNQGSTWTTSPIGCGQPVAPQDHQTVVAGKSRGTPAPLYQNRIVYYCVNRVFDSSCATSLDGGLTYGPLIPIMPGVDTEAGRPCGGLHGHVKTDNAGRVFLPKAQCGVPTVGVSEDDGKTWKTYKISTVGTRKSGNGDLGDHEVALAADASDNLYAFWIGENALPQLSISKDHGHSWTPARTVSPPGVTAADKPAIYASAEGKVAFAYIGSTIQDGYAKKPACTGGAPNFPPGSGTPRDCTKRNAAWANATWNAYIGIMTDALSENAMVLTSTANDPADPIAIHECGATRCDGLYDFIDVTIDPTGRPWASFVDVCLAKCLEDFHAEPLTAKHDGNVGFAGTLATGPALTAAGGALPAFADLATNGAH